MSGDRTRLQRGDSPVAARMMAWRETNRLSQPQAAAMLGVRTNQWVVWEAWVALPSESWRKRIETLIVSPVEARSAEKVGAPGA